LIEVPVKRAVIWSKPRAVRPRAGHATVKALTGGWCDVCSVRYDTRMAFDGGALDGAASDGGIVSDTADAFLAPLGSLRLAVLPAAAARAAVSIRGALSSVSQLH
jgi:hypothetical protein